MKPLPLEDNFNDIIGKAMRGLSLSADKVSALAGISADRLQALVSGEFDEGDARKIAPVLGLNADALTASGRKAWRPQDIELNGLAQFTTPWDDMMVNSYVVWDPRSSAAAVFDTGADCQPMLDFIKEKKLIVVKIALTHTHGDHVFDLDRLKARTGAQAVVGPKEPIDGAEPIGDQPFWVGTLHVESRSTWGHSKGGLTYVVSGLAKRVAVDGDAVFAGSMGGGGVSYADALRTNRDEIFTLPDETVLCPGHGPLTTIGEERQHNPFFA